MSEILILSTNKKERHVKKVFDQFGNSMLVFVCKSLSSGSDNSSNQNNVCGRKNYLSWVSWPFNFLWWILSASRFFRLGFGLCRVVLIDWMSIARQNSLAASMDCQNSPEGFQALAIVQDKKRFTFHLLTPGPPPNPKTGEFVISQYCTQCCFVWIRH